MSRRASPAAVARSGSFRPASAECAHARNVLGMAAASLPQVVGNLFARAAITVLVASTLVLGQPARPASAACVASTGPGIPAPTGLTAGIPGFHARWYGQSGYPTLCPGGRSTATVAFYNSGSLGWVSGR